MDKYELNIKTDQMKKLVRREDYETAAEIADTIDWKKVKNGRQLLLCADAYHHVGRLAKEKEVLLIAYDRIPMGRQVAYRLCQISIALGDLEDAEDFYEDFAEMSPSDTARYLLKYSLMKAEHVDIAEQIEVLETFVEEDMEENWAYELASLYRRAGQDDKCIALCDELMLWFQEGEFVKKAAELKMEIAPLTGSQQKLYDRILKGEASSTSVMGETESQIGEEEEQGIIAERIQVRTAEDIDADLPDMDGTVIETEPEAKADTELTKEAGTEREGENQILEMEPDNLDIHVKTYEGELYDTINIQEELAKSMEALMKEEKNREVPTDTFLKPEEPEPTEDSEADLHPDLSEDIDGQISLDIEATKKEDRQITGQMNLEEMLRSLQERGILKEETVNKAVELTTATLPIGELNDILSEVEASLEPEGFISKMVEEEPDKEQGEASSEATMSLQSTATPESEGIIIEKSEGISGQTSADGEEEMLKENVLEDTHPVHTIEENRYTEMRNRQEEHKYEEVDDVLQMIENLESEEEPQKENLYHSYKEEKEEEQYYLSDEYKEIFKRFLRMSGVENQIAVTMKNIVMQENLEGTSEINNVAITGEAKSGKTALALELLKAVNKERGKEGRKAAKVSSSVLNRKGLLPSMPKLLGMDLIIGDAGSLNQESLIQLQDVLRKYTADMIVVLMDTKKSIQHLFTEHPMLETMFNNQINLHEYDINEWVTVAKDYARTESYYIDEMGTLALYAKVDALYGLNRSIEVEDIEKIIDDAIDHAERFTLGRLFRGKKKSGNLKALREGDFL